MKSSGFANKPRKPLKRTPLARQSPTKRATIASKVVKPKKTIKSARAKKKTPKQLKNKLWQLCKEVVRRRDGNVCVICKQQNLVGSNWHTGHLIPRSTCGALLRYDIRNLHSSCYYCNINLGGNGATYVRYVESKYGRDFVDSLFLDKEKFAKDDSHLLLHKIKEYEEIQTWSKAELFDYTRNYQTTWLTSEGTLSM